MGTEKKKINLSSDLLKAIYNPDLPSKWKAYPDHIKLMMFHKLFLLLNPVFQEKYGTNLDMYYRFVKREWYFKDLESSYESPECDSGHFSCVHLISTLFREEYIPGNYSSVFDFDISASAYFEQQKRRAGRNVMRYLDERSKGKQPQKVYLKIDLRYTKEKINEDFIKKLKQLHKEYYKQNPSAKTFKYGHIPKKADGRKRTYPFEEFARYYKVYVLDHLRGRGEKQKDLVHKVFPNDSNISAIEKLNMDLKKAKNLIQNSWLGNFPGKYI